MSTKNSPNKKTWFGISRTVITLGFVSLLTDISSEGIYPLIPLFLTNVLHTSVAAIGLIEGIAESVASILRIFSGWFSDRVENRKWITAAGYALSTVSKPVLAVTTAWPQVLGVRFSDRVGKGIRSAPRDALIADVTPTEKRGIAFGFHRAMDTVGAVTGPLLAFWLLRSLHLHYRNIFMLSAIPGVLGVLILIFFVREKSSHRDGSEPPASLSLRGFDRKYKEFLLVAVLFSIGNSSDAFLILRAQNVGISPAHVLLVYVLFNTVEATFSILTGALSDRFGRRNVILVGYLIFALVYAGFGFTQNPLVIWILFGMYGLYNASTQGVQRAFAADLMGTERRGTGMGAYHMLTGIALLPASVTAGLLWKSLGPSAPFYYGAATAIIAAILLMVFFRSQFTCSDT